VFFIIFIVLVFVWLIAYSIVLVAYSSVPHTKGFIGVVSSDLQQFLFLLSILQFIFPYCWVCFEISVRKSENHVFWELLSVYAQAWDTGAQACRARLNSGCLRPGVEGWCNACNNMLILWKNMFSERYLTWIVFVFKLDIFKNKVRFDFIL
jgi:hypothetical protein